MKKVLFLFLFVISYSFFGQVQINGTVYGNGTAYGGFGHRVSLSSDGLVLAVGCGGDYQNRSGSVKVFKNENNAWIQVGNDIVGSAFSSLGQSVALSSDGTILAVGAPGTGYHSAVNDFGYVNLYKNINNVWTQIGSTITAEEDNSYFGGTIDLSPDGNTIAIGARFYSQLAGKVQVFKNIDGVWTQSGPGIYGNNPDDNVGMSLSLASNGNQLAVGVYNFGSLTRRFVRLYEYNEGTWTQKGEDISFGGLSVDLSEDGNMLATGDPVGSEGYGKVRVFQKIDGSFTQIGSDFNSSHVWDQFGDCVKLSADGGILAIGSPWFGQSSSRNGKVDIYKMNNHEWLQKTTIFGSDYGDLCGEGISLSSDGSIVAAGSPGSRGLFNSTSSGAVKIFDVTTTLAFNTFIPDHFSVYPNPARDVINIDLQRNFLFEKAKIYDNAGRIIKTATIKNINTSDLQTGAYFIEVITDKGKAVKPFLKK